MVSRRLAFGWLVAIGLMTVPGRLLQADEPPADHPKTPAAEPAHDAADPAKEKADKTDSVKAKADKAEAAKKAAKDEEEFYDLYKSLADTVDQVDRNYVKKVDRRELMEAAIKGVLSKLDPYSSYIGREEAGRFKDTVENQFGGIGIQITMDENQIKILSPLVGTPGYKAGLMAGDRITKIGDESTAELS